MPVDELDATENVRSQRTTAETAALVDSIKAIGIRVPVLVVPADGASGKKYRLLDGFGRLAAAIKLRYTHLPAVLARTSQVAAESLVSAYAANSCREALTQLDQGALFASLLDLTSLNVTDLARRLGVSQEHVSTCLRLYRAGKGIREDLRAGRISVKEAIRLARERDPKRQPRSQKPDSVAGTARKPTWVDDTTGLSFTVAVRRGAPTPDNLRAALRRWLQELDASGAVLSPA